MSDYQIETRRRSRSNTPLLRSQEPVGEEGQKKKRTGTSPTVQTIIEETEQVTSSSTTPTKKKQSADNKTSTKQTKQKTQEMSSTTSSSTTIITTKIQKLIGSHAATSTPKSGNNSKLEEEEEQQQSFASSSKLESSAKEVAQNELNDEFERTQQQAANSSKNGSFFSRLFSSSFNASNRAVASADSSMAHDNDLHENLSNQLPYLEYKRAGEYWNTTPKTDYTYSPLSENRRFLAPGVVAMPNMSRRSLSHHHERVERMVQRNPAEEQQIRSRYEYSWFTKRRQQQNSNEPLLYDSGDEVDAYRNGKYRMQQQQHAGNWFARFITSIVSISSSTWHKLSGQSADDSLYRTRIESQQKGFFGSLAHGVTTAFMSLFRSLYILVSSIVCLDAWFLRSSNPDNKQKKRFLLALLLLLPLLLLGGLYYYLNPHETFPPKSFSELTFTLPELPKLPQINVSEYFNEQNYEEIKLKAVDGLEGLRDWSHEYWLYMKALGQNAYDEARKRLIREEYYERV